MQKNIGSKTIGSKNILETNVDEIKRLRNAIEEKIGRKAVAPVDFNYIAMQIKQDVGDSVSVSTLKRIWGYVSYKSKPSKSILSIMARFVGFTSWNSFCDSKDVSTYIESQDLSGKVVNAAEINIGDIVEIEWRPNRYCKLECIGKKLFKVVESHNSKLFPGNVFHAELFGKGMPFYVTDLQQNYSEGRIYVAGERHGLTSVKVKTKTMN